VNKSVETVTVTLLDQRSKKSRRVNTAHGETGDCLGSGVKSDIFYYTLRQNDTGIITTITDGRISI